MCAPVFCARYQELYAAFGALPIRKALIHGIEVERRSDSYGPAKYFFHVDESTDSLTVEKLLRQAYEKMSAACDIAPERCTKS